jgi:PAS domain-containing protein
VTVDRPELESDPSGSSSFRILVDQLPAVFWTTDADLRFTSSLGAGLARLGLGPNQVVGMTLFEFFETEDVRFPPIAAHARALTGDTVTFEMDWAGRALRARVAPLRDSEGRPIGTICVALDSPERPVSHLTMAS